MGWELYRWGIRQNLSDHFLNQAKNDDNDYQSGDVADDVLGMGWVWCGGVYNEPYARTIILGDVPDGLY